MAHPSDKDNQYTRLPAVLQTSAVKNFFEYTVDQLYSEANVETLNGFVGTPDWDGVRAEGQYIQEPTATKQAYSLSPTISTISPETGEPESLIYYDEVVDLLKTYGVDARNQNKLFDEPYFTFSPPIDEDKLLNYSEYYWAPPSSNVAPQSQIIEGHPEDPVDVEADIIGQQYFVYDDVSANAIVTFRNGMVVEFQGPYINPYDVYNGNTFVVSGVGESISLVKYDRNTSAPYDPNTTKSYVTIERGSTDNNGWSRNNYWFHKNNWYDAGQTPPDRSYRAERPIIEFDHRLELYNSGNSFLQSVDIAVTTYDYNQVNGLGGNILIDGVNPNGKTFIFPNEQYDIAEHIYLGTSFEFETNVIISGSNTSQATATVDIAGKPGEGFVDRINVVEGGDGYFDADAVTVTIDTDDPNVTSENRAEANALVARALPLGTSTINMVDTGTGYDSNTAVVTAVSQSGNVVGITPAQFSPLIDQSGNILSITVTDTGSGYESGANIDIIITGANTTPAVAEVVTYIDEIVGFVVNKPGSGYSAYQSIVPTIVATAVPGDQVIINEGNTQRGNEYRFTEGGWVLAQTKSTPNEAPLFVIYDDAGVRMDDDAKYPQSDFVGNKIFSYATVEDVVDEDAANIAISTNVDTELGFTVVYRPFKAASEIVFTNNLEHDKYTYEPIGSDDRENILGYNFYHLISSDTDDEYYPYWKPSPEPFNQAIVSRYFISQIQVDQDQRAYFIGCDPDYDAYGGFSQIAVKGYLNGKQIYDFDLNTEVQGFVSLGETIVLKNGDYLEFIAYSEKGLISLQSISKYELPLGWDRNVFKENIRFTSEPEYLAHFKTQIESQLGFVGEPLGQNNYPSTAKETKYATEIVQSSSDLILAGYLLDDQPHNMIDALRFNSGEYGKYKARLRKSINEYYATNAVDENNIDKTLEMILREVIAFRVGKNVFNRTYVVPFGDNFVSETETVGPSQTEIVTESFLDLSLIEHSLLVFGTPPGSLTNDMLLIDTDYIIINYNPITIRLLRSDFLGYTITTKLYTAERDSAQCPPTPSVMGLYPLFSPEITIDDSFETPIQVIVGHDGSSVPAYGDVRDQLLLDFEQRIYNAAKKEFREANSLPELSYFDTRPGFFRSTGFGYTEWYNLMRYHFSTWTSVNDLDPVTNEFYDISDPWTWNYRGTSDTFPGHWRGLYEYYFDTVKPHTHPWEMLGFTEQPLWWIEQYGANYGSGNTAMWDDLEYGIIRQGPRENITYDLWKLDTNPYARPDLFKIIPVDAEGNLLPPNSFDSGTVETSTSYSGQIVEPNNIPIFADSFIQQETGNVAPGISVSESGGNVYVQSQGLLNYEPPPGRYEPQSFQVNLPKKVTYGPSQMPVGDGMVNGGLVGVAVNGIAIMNPNAGRSPNTSDIWHYNEVFDGNYNYENPGKYDSRGGYEYYVIPPLAIGITQWITDVHSPVIGWALDGLPIYGPYGYSEYNNDGSVYDNTITNIKSPFVLRTDGDRTRSPGGAPTGLFVEDYKIDAALVGTAGYAGTNIGLTQGENFAIRYGVTPESPTTPVWFYVQCQDDDGKVMFPYGVGGGVQEHPDGAQNNNIYNNQFYGTPTDFGGIFDIKITDCGYGYTPLAVVTFEGDGDNAAAFAETSDGAIRNVVVLDQGKNYNWQSTTIEILGDGTGAKAEPIVIDGKIVGVNMTSFGSGYTFATVIVKQVANADGTFPGQFAQLTIPTVAEDPANGIVNNAVTNIVVTNKGYGYTELEVIIEGVIDNSPPQPTFTGQGATAEVTLETRYNNNTGDGYVDPDGNDVIVDGEQPITIVDTKLTGASWMFSDGSPVENAWKYSENYPFAIAEALLLAQPAKFATQFSDPTKLTRAKIDPRQQISTVTRERWQFTDPAQFTIHGERDSQGNFITNIGYTQFINSWLAFQGLDTNIEFAPQMRTINMRLSQRMSGYVDKDTMTVRTDQYSSTGTSTSLIIPQDNINIQVHSSPYKTRNFYTGVIIEKVTGGYKVRGYDRSIGTFPQLKINKQSPSRAIKVGGEPAPFSAYQRNEFYKKNSIVDYAGSFYKAKTNLTTGDNFDTKLWNRLPSLPQINGAEAQVWSAYLNQVEFTPYEALLTTPQQVVDLLLGMGAWQSQQGYEFGEFNSSMGAVLNWEHAANQFLFWTTGKWEIGNTIELSPMAAQVTFRAPNGFIAKLNRIDRNQFTILDVDGSAIQPENCEIIRLDDYIQIKPPQGSQIYGVLVFVKEIEHAMTLDNRTDFNDIIYDPVLHQYQTRVKIKGKKTAGWTGKFLSDGFIILDDELKPNLDNLAQSMGRYHELGFIPVEKQVYESARALFGYQSRDYMRDLDILDDQQFDFYKGFLQSKGTQTSLTRIGEANSIVIDGNITVYDEWAVSVGDFGDVESQQAIEFKLDRSNVTSDPQLVVLEFPEDVTGVVERIDVIDRIDTYSVPPVVRISPPITSEGRPSPGGRQASAQAYLKDDGKLDWVEVTDKGRGYEFATATIIVNGADNNNGDNQSGNGNNIEFDQVVAQGGLTTKAWSETPINGNCYISISNGSISYTEMTVTLLPDSNTKINLFTTNTNTGYEVNETLTLSGLTGIVTKSSGSNADLSTLNGTWDITNVTETTAGTNLEFIVDDIVGDTDTYGVNIIQDFVSTKKFVFDNVEYRYEDILLDSFGGQAVEDIFNAETANTGVSARMYVSHVPNERQPGQTGIEVVDWYTLVLRSNTEFTLVDESPSNVFQDQFHITPATYTNQQRWKIDVSGDTTQEDISVIINGQIVDQCKYFEVDPNGQTTGNCDVYNWQYLPGNIYVGDTTSPSNATLRYSANANSSMAFLSTTDTLGTPVNFVDETTGVSVNGEYPFLDLYVGNVLIDSERLVYTTPPNSNVQVATWQTVYDVTETSPGNITVYTQYLPETLTNDSGNMLLANASLKVVEAPSIKFTEDFVGDTAGSNVNIIVEGEDGLAVKIGRERTYEITKDIANDDIIVIDVDDPTRFLKKPTGEMTTQLWPTMDDINYYGVRDSKEYPTLPNSGYVNSGNVNFQAYDLGSLPQLFDPSYKITPTGGHTIHIASSENKDWNVYELKPTNASVEFLARQDDRVSLFTDFSLFNYIDSNIIGEEDTGRYLDYYLTLRNSDLSDNVVIWTNETIVQQAQSTVTNLSAPRMIEARIRSIGPSENSVREFTDYLPAGGDFYPNAVISPSGLDQPQVKDVTTTIITMAWDETQPVITNYDLSVAGNANVVNFATDGVGAEFDLTFNTQINDAGTFTSYLEDVTVLNAGNGYISGETFTVEIFDEQSEIPLLLTVDETQAVERGYKISNIVTVGGIVNSTIREGDSIRLINGGNYYYATVDQANIVIDASNSIVEFSNVSNYTDFVVGNSVYLSKLGASTNSLSANVNLWNWRVSSTEIANSVVLSATNLNDSDTLLNLTPSDFSSNVSLRTFNVFDFGEIPNPNDLDSFYIASNVKRNSGVTSFEVERPDTYFNNEDVTADFIDLEVSTPILIKANVTADLFTSGDAVRINGYTGDLGVINGVWPIINVSKYLSNVSDPSTHVSDFITFNIIKPLTLGTYETPPEAIKTDGFGTVNVVHMDKTRLVMPNVGDINVGDNIKVVGNVFSGTYSVDSVELDFSNEGDNSFTAFVDIPAPYIFDSNRTGNALKGGMKITTTNPHGITPQYASQNKRVGVHFAYPKAYNRFYNITSVDAYNIYIDDVLTQTDETVEFYRYETFTVSQDNPTYVTVSNPYLSKTTATYASNASVIEPSKYVVNGENITFMESALPNDGSYITVNIIRENNRSFDRYPVVTTKDHNKIRLNGVDFTINSYNNPQAIVDNINRIASLNRGWVTPTGSGMQFSFPMVKDYREPVFAPDGTLRPAYTINNYGPYIRDKNSIARMLSDADVDTSVISLASEDELTLDKDFNLGSIKIGPTRGATYYDQENKVWMLWLQEGSTDTQGSYIPIGNFYNPQNVKQLPKRPKSFQNVPSGHAENGRVLDKIPGSYPVRRGNESKVGVTRYEYDMGATKTYKFPLQWIDASGTEVVPTNILWMQDSNREPGTIKLPRFRLRPSMQGYYEVYEFVELTDGEVIAIKVDSAVPPLEAHNYFVTQSTYGLFFGLPLNSVNFDTKVGFNAAAVDLYPTYRGGSITMGPVEPPADIGKTLIPEPFAIKRSGKTLGNGTDALRNWQSLPLSSISQQRGIIVIDYSQQGYDQFNIWQAGLIPGRKNPPTNTSTNMPYPFGKGRGYYEQGDGNNPEMFQVVSASTDVNNLGLEDCGNVTMGWDEPRNCPRDLTDTECTNTNTVTNDYPQVDSTLGWFTPQPRIKYSKRFNKIEPSTSNDYDVNVLNEWATADDYLNSQDSRFCDIEGNIVNGDYTNIQNGVFRPDELFISCFWTEPHTYVNQTVGYGPDVSNSGNRQPIIKDYYGTITRCKYIRLTELPFDAVLQRPECDTGWGGDENFTAQDNSLSNGTSDSLNLLGAQTDVSGGTSATQNNNVNTGADFTGGVSPEDPNPALGAAFDIDNTQQLPAGYQNIDGTLVQPGDVAGPELANPEARRPVGVGELDVFTQEEISNLGNDRAVPPAGIAAGVAPFDNAGSAADPNTPNTSLNNFYNVPSAPNNSFSPIFDPPYPILPGPCDVIDATTPPGTGPTTDCQNSESTVLFFTGSNNYYGIKVTGDDWRSISEDKNTDKYEVHSFGKFANYYNGANNGVVELVVDFRDDTLTGAGVTLVQSPTEWGKLADGTTFDSRNINQQASVLNWWRRAKVVNSVYSANQSSILTYGVDPLPSYPGVTNRNAGSTNIPSVAKIGLSMQDGQNFKPKKFPNDFGPLNTDTVVTDFILGGGDEGIRGQLGVGGFGNLNGLKGAFMFSSDQIDCTSGGEYLIAFIHIGDGSGISNGQPVVPRYDFWIRYNHNVSGFGAATGPTVDACGDGSYPQSADYAGGAAALAFKSQTTTVTNLEYSEAACAMPLIGSSESIAVEEDKTNLLQRGVSVTPWKVANIYFPYNRPIRNGNASNENVDDDTGPGGPGPGGGGCVVLDSYLPGSTSQAYKLYKGASLLLGTEDLKITEGKVKEILTDKQPCVRVTTSKGVVLECSTTAPIYTQDGEYVDAPDLLGKYVAVNLLGATSFDEVISVTDIGEQFVAVIDTGDNNFWAGAKSGAYMMHHNIGLNFTGINWNISKN